MGWGGKARTGCVRQSGEEREHIEHLIARAWLVERGSRWSKANRCREDGSRGWGGQFVNETGACAINDGFLVRVGAERTTAARFSEDEIRAGFFFLLGLECVEKCLGIIEIIQGRVIGSGVRGTCRDLGVRLRGVVRGYVQVMHTRGAGVTVGTRGLSRGGMWACVGGRGGALDSFQNAVKRGHTFYQCLEL
jgi:hypothetical protein